MDEYIGVIKIFGGNFAPHGWALCDGRIMSIAQNQALFSVIGTMYGGDGQTTFGLPDLRGRTAVGMGQGHGLPNVDLGELAGEVNHTLIANEIPMHNHLLAVSSGNANEAAATSGASIAAPGELYSTGDFSPTLGYNSSKPDTVLNPVSVGIAGGSQPHNNMQPYLGVNYIICLEGLYPTRS
jgi:microcystin-dependent protein